MTDGEEHLTGIITGSFGNPLKHHPLWNQTYNLLYFLLMSGGTEDNGNIRNGESDNITSLQRETKLENSLIL
jgi:hypothetical protein